MNYLLAIYGDASTWATQSEEANAELDALATIERDAAEAGILVGNEALEPELHTLSIHNGIPRVTDESLTKKERRLGCFYIVDCENLTEVTEWAARIPLVGDGGFHSIEIRPVLG